MGLTSRLAPSFLLASPASGGVDASCKASRLAVFSCSSSSILSLTLTCTCLLPLAMQFEDAFVASTLCFEPLLYWETDGTLATQTPYP